MDNTDRKIICVALGLVLAMLIIGWINDRNFEKRLTNLEPIETCVTCGK